MTTTSQEEEKTFAQQFAEHMKNCRVAIGMSQADLAQKVYGDRTYRGHISKIETGKKNASAKTMGFILIALNSKASFSG